MSRRTREVEQRIAELHARLEAQTRATDHERALRRAAENRAEAAEAAAEVYVARTAAGDRLYEGGSRGIARTAARNHYWSTGEGTRVEGPDGVLWDSWTHGGTRR